MSETQKRNIEEEMTELEKVLANCLISVASGFAAMYSLASVTKWEVNETVKNEMLYSFVSSEMKKLQRAIRDIKGEEFMRMFEDKVTKDGPLSVENIILEIKSKSSEAQKGEEEK